MKYRLRKEFTTNPDMALSEILSDRGVEDLQNFLNPTFACELSPYNLENIEAGAEMLLKHLRANNSILFIQDCDVDGITSSAILWLYIKQLFPQANLEFRVHEHKQHGMDDMIDWMEEASRWQLVIAPDSSSYDIEEHQRLNEIGIDCLVLDHHEQAYDDYGNPIISDAPRTIVINNQLSPKYRNKSLCGAGVVYKFCEVLDDILGVQLASEFLDLVALGEIADVMDRTDPETNYLMLTGLKNIKNEGLRTLIEGQSFSLKEKANPPYEGLTPIDIAFYIAPLLNSITRVGTLQDKMASFYCFVDPHRAMPSTKRGAKDGDTEEAAEQTMRVGKNCKSRQDKLKEQALGIIDFKIQKDGLDDNNIIFVEIDEQDKILPELTGLVAMNVVSKYHKPVMIGRRNANNEVKGSIRSSGNFAGLPNFKEFLENSKLMTFTAGHDNAAGFGINGNKVDQLINRANTTLSAKDFDNCYVVDYILDANNNNAELIASIAAHPEYFGNHIEEVYFVIKNIPLSNVMLMGANRDSVKITHNNIYYVKFKDEEFASEIMENRMKTLTVYGRGNLNYWAGQYSVQIFINDYELVDVDKYAF